MAAISYARPAVSDLVLRVFERRLHPEFFDSLAAIPIRTPHYIAEIRLCPAGHLLWIQTPRGHLTEIITEGQHPLSQQNSALTLRLRGGRTHTQTFGSLVYNVAFQVEQLSPEVFLQVHDELSMDALRSELTIRLGSSSRMAPAAISLMTHEVLGKSLSVHAYHTFPEECVVVKTQTLLEIHPTT